jgi:hypothetical protein
MRLCESIGVASLKISNFMAYRCQAVQPVISLAVPDQISRWSWPVCANTPCAMTVTWLIHDAMQRGDAIFLILHKLAPCSIGIGDISGMLAFS